jgi:hypothetical protein
VFSGTVVSINHLSGDVGEVPLAVIRIHATGGHPTHPIF